MKALLQPLDTFSTQPHKMQNQANYLCNNKLKTHFHLTYLRRLQCHQASLCV